MTLTMGCRLPHSTVDVHESHGDSSALDVSVTSQQQDIAVTVNGNWWGPKNAKRTVTFRRNSGLLVTIEAKFGLTNVPAEASFECDGPVRLLYNAVQTVDGATLAYFHSGTGVAGWYVFPDAKYNFGDAGRSALPFSDVTVG